MSNRRAARSSRAKNETIIDSTADLVLDTDQPDDNLPAGMVNDQPSNLLPALVAGGAFYDRMLAFLAAANEPTKLVIDALANVTADADLNAIASDMLATPATGTAAAVAWSARYDIGLHAARLMMRLDVGVSSAAVLIRESLDRMHDRRGIPIPRVWRELVHIDHALKCWLPGTVASASLSKCWPAAIKRPFYGLPVYVVSRIRLGQPGYDHGGMVCDYWSRIHPGKLSLLVVERFDQLTTRDDRRAFLRELLNVD